MTQILKQWRLRRLRGRLERVEREKDHALQSLIVRDQAVTGSRPRYDYQDPGSVGTMLDEIAGLQARISLLEHEPEPVADADAAPAAASARPSRLRPAEPRPPEPRPAAPRSGAVVDTVFEQLREALTRMQMANAGGRIDADGLRDALHDALASDRVLDATFRALRVEMVRMQRSTASSRINLEALHAALCAALATDEPAPPADARWTGSWPDLNRPGTPAAPGRDGWHWLQAAGRPLVALSWHAETGAWGHRAGLPARRVFDDGLRYFGPCPLPATPQATTAPEPESAEPEPDAALPEPAQPVPVA